MPLQEFPIFLLKRDRPMMILLTFNVLNFFIQLIASDGKRAISPLPCKPGIPRVYFLYPP